MDSLYWQMLKQSFIGKGQFVLTDAGREFGKGQFVLTDAGREFDW